MKKTPGKLRSERGASLLVSLLLFMICSVIGIVVLTAASGAVGRAGKLAENDQRYFSVASAAELLAQELNGQSVTITREKETKVVRTATITYDDAGTETSNDTKTTWTVTYHTEVGGAAAALADYIKGPLEQDDMPEVSPSEGTGISMEGRSLLTELALRLLFGEGKCNNDDAFESSFAGGGYAGYAAEGFLSLTPSGELSGLVVKGKYWLRSDGLLFIELSNPEENNKFTMVLTLQPDYQDSSEWSETVDPQVTVTKTKYENETTTTGTETKTSTVSWTVVSIGEKTDVGFDSDKAAGSGGTPPAEGGDGA